MFLFGKSKAKKVFINPPLLKTDRLILRKITLSDTADMYEYSKNPETSKYLLWEKHPSFYFTKCHILNLQKMYKRASFFDWGIEFAENGKFIGTVGFTEIYDDDNSAQVGYVLSPKYHRMGIASEALNKIMEFGFCTLGFSSLSARFMEDNLASRKVLEKCGFHETEFDGDIIQKRGKIQRIISYKITKDEYFKQKNNG